MTATVTAGPRATTEAWRGLAGKHWRDKYPEPAVRVSGYAVDFVRLTREQQLDVISGTFHGSL